MSTEWNEAVDIRSLLVSVLHKESRELRKGRCDVNDVEMAMDTSLIRSGWAAGDVNYIVSASDDNERHLQRQP